jgi:hypothetical protein
MMYATLISSKPVSKPGLQPSSITRSIVGILAALVALACTNLRLVGQDSSQPWRDAPEYVRLFAPSSQRTAYRAYVSSQGLEATLNRLLTDPAVLRPPGAWTPRAMIPYDAFGLSGSYNRWKVAGLYRSRRAQVARGPRLDQGQMESWTLIAPYPDVSLQRLEPGTLIIVLRVPSD